MRFLLSIGGGLLGAALFIAGTHLVDTHWVKQSLASAEVAIGMKTEVPVYQGDPAPVRRQMTPAYRPAQASKLGPLY